MHIMRQDKVKFVFLTAMEGIWRDGWGVSSVASTCLYGRASGLPTSASRSKSTGLDRSPSSGILNLHMLKSSFCSLESSEFSIFSLSQAYFPEICACCALYHLFTPYPWPPDASTCAHMFKGLKRKPFGISHRAGPRSEFQVSDFIVS